MKILAFSRNRFALLFSVIFWSAAIVQSASAERLLCQRNKEKKPSTNGPVLNLLLVKGTTCPQGFRKLGFLLEEQDVDAAISNSLSVNNVAGPQGEKGDKGDQGSQGAQGTQGQQGLVGATGPVGPMGPQGLAGEQGAVGATGAQGEVGATGPQGEQGAQGAPGILNIDACYPKTESREGVLDETETVYCDNPATEFIQNIGHEIDRNDVFTTHQVLEFTYNGNSYSHPVGGTIRAYRHSGIFNYTLTVTVLCCPM